MKKKRTIKHLLVMLIFSLLIWSGKNMDVNASSKIHLNTTAKTTYVQSNVKLKVKGTSKKVKWSSSSKKIATVTNKGVVKAKKTGTVTITAKVAGKKLTCKITVYPKYMKYFSGNWYTCENGMYGPIGKSRFTLKYVYRYVRNDKGKFYLASRVPVKYQKTSYGYYITLIGKNDGYRYDYKFKNDLHNIGGGNPYSKDYESGGSSLCK